MYNIYMYNLTKNLSTIFTTKLYLQRNYIHVFVLDVSRVLYRKFFETFSGSITVKFTTLV